MDQADIFLMQSWDHILHLMQHIHLQPVTTHGTDFSRIRPWAVDGHSRFYLQTLIFSSVVCPEHHSLLSKHCKNFAGQAKLLNTVISGSISQIMCHLPQVCLAYRIECKFPFMKHCIEKLRFCIMDYGNLISFFFYRSFISLLVRQLRKQTMQDSITSLIKFCLISVAN